MRYSDQRWPVGGDDVAYGQSTGRLRILETRLLAAVELETAIRQGDNATWKQLLDRLDYPAGADLLQRVNKAGEAADALLVELSMDKVLSYGLLLYQPYHNLKVFLKALLPSDGQSVKAAWHDEKNDAIPEHLKELLYFNASENIETCRKLVVETLVQTDERPVDPADYNSFSDEFIGMDELRADSFIRTHVPEIFKHAVLAAARSYAAVSEVGQIDAVLDKFYFAHLAALANRSRQAFLRVYAELKADIANMNILYRSVKLKLEATKVSELWVPGGQIKNGEALTKLLREDAAAWRKAWSATPVNEIAAIAFAASHSNGGEVVPPGTFAKAADDMVMDLARSGLKVVYGPQVVAGYWLAKQAEIRNLRLLFSLRAQGKDREALLGLMREVYIHG